MATAITILTYASYVIAGVVVALTAIAPLTKNEWDNKLLSALVWIHDNLLVRILPAHTVTAKTAETSENK